MKQIDKNVHRAEFDIYTNQYLHDAQTDQGDFYPKLSLKESYYDGFSERKYKTRNITPSAFNGWLDVLMREQEEEGISRCCYCMRELKGNEISVEHLIPESFEGLDSEEEYKFYCKYAPELKRHVALGSTLDKISQRVKIDATQLKRKPHLIAHSNLFPACNKEYGCSCNNDRHNFRILPLMLMQDVENGIRYKEDGKIIILHADFRSVKATYENLQINRETLVQIRHLWYLFSRKQIKPTAQNATDENQMKSFIEQAFDGNIEVKYQKYYNNEYYRQLIPQYNWFYTYYSNKYPLQ